MKTETPEAIFDRHASSLLRWQESARELIAAGNFAYRRFEVVARRESNRARRMSTSTYMKVGVFMMLYGFGAENLLKALLIARGEVPASRGALTKLFKSHNLCAYADRAGLELTAGDAALLAQLQRATEVGRYPIGTNTAKSRSLWIVIARRDEAVAPEDPTQPRIVALLQRIESDIRALRPRELLPPVRFERLGIAPVRVR